MSQLDPGLALVLTAFIGVLGYWLQSVWTKRKEVEIQSHQMKRELLSSIVEEIPYVFIPEHRDALSKEEKQRHAQKFFWPYAKLWLCTSDDTIRRMNAILDLYSTPQPQDTPTRTVAEFIVSMRRESGIKTELLAKDVRFIKIPI